MMCTDCLIAVCLGFFMRQGTEILKDIIFTLFVDKVFNSLVVASCSVVKIRRLLHSKTDIDEGEGGSNSRSDA